MKIAKNMGKFAINSQADVLYPYTIRKVHLNVYV